MGEYWKPVNLTKREYIHPHDLNDGLKLGEWNWPGSRTRQLMVAGSAEEIDEDSCRYGELDDKGFARVTDRTPPSAWRGVEAKAAFADKLQAMGNTQESE